MMDLLSLAAERSLEIGISKYPLQSVE